MEIERILMVVARVLALATVGAIVVSALYLMFQGGRIVAKREKSREIRGITFVGLAVAAVSTIVLGFSVSQYLLAQTQRHTQLNRVLGISPELDEQIINSSATRVSYIHTQGLIERAAALCQKSENGTINNTPQCKLLVGNDR